MAGAKKRPQDHHRRASAERAAHDTLWPTISARDQLTHALAIIAQRPGETCGLGAGAWTWVPDHSIAGVRHRCYSRPASACAGRAQKLRDAHDTMHLPVGIERAEGARTTDGDGPAAIRQDEQLGFPPTGRPKARGCASATRRSAQSWLFSPRAIAPVSPVPGRAPRVRPAIEYVRRGTRVPAALSALYLRAVRGLPPKPAARSPW